MTPNHLYLATASAWRRIAYAAISESPKQGVVTKQATDIDCSISALAYMAGYKVLSKCRKLTSLTLFAFVIIDDEIKRRMEATMEGIYL